MGGDGASTPSGAVAHVVSIHTPVWGVTTKDLEKYTSNEVSIHTPVWGVTYLRHLRQLPNQCFNPHPRMGGDEGYLWQTQCQRVSIHTPVWGVTPDMPQLKKHRLVSIHTPVWGVTDFRIVTPYETFCFNPHPRMGGDHMTHVKCTTNGKFQSTPPYGG